MKTTAELNRFQSDKLLSSSRNTFRFFTIFNFRKLTVKKYTRVVLVFTNTVKMTFVLDFDINKKSNRSCQLIASLCLLVNLKFEKS